MDDVARQVKLVMAPSPYLTGDTLANEFPLPMLGDLLFQQF